MGDRAAAVAMFNAAVTAANDRSQPSHLERSYQLFGSACVADPTYGQAYYQMGNNNADLKRIHAAIASWRVALTCDITPDERGKTLTNLGWFLYTIGEVDEALQVSLEATQLIPDGYQAYNNLSVIYGLLDDDQKSIAAAEKAFEIDPTNVQNEIALAFALMFDKQYARGLKHFEKRFDWRLQAYNHAPYPRWQGEPDGTVYLMSDQGLGDALSFARFVETACKRCKYVHASIHPELLRLFQHSFIGIKNLNLIPQPQPFPQADYWSTFMSLPAALGLTDDEIINQPHIPMARFDTAQNWKVPDRKLHIGIAWRGNPQSDIDKYRSIPLEHFLELYRVPGIQLYSLQVDQFSQELYDQGALVMVRDLKPYIRDVVDSVSVLQHLDMVICLESALGHIAGLANKECWFPYSMQGRDYRAGHKGDKPIWYPKHRFFRQQKGESWKPVFERIIEALNERIGKA